MPDACTKVCACLSFHGGQRRTLGVCSISVSHIPRDPASLSTALGLQEPRLLFVLRKDASQGRLLLTLLFKLTLLLFIVVVGQKIKR